ncbi:MAG TPA: GAF domain-containing protein, partial [Thermoanaerobaculia bacterium]
MAREWVLEDTRLDAIDELLLTLAGSLDVRAIFNEVSAVVQPVLPHDRLILGMRSADRTLVTIDALSGEPVADLPLRIPIEHGEAERKKKLGQAELIADLEAWPSSHASACARQLGVRSTLRIPLRPAAGQAGSLVFASRAPARYSADDLPVARRIADYVSLALSHQRLAEEELRAAEARERAAHLEERVEA